MWLGKVMSISHRADRTKVCKKRSLFVVQLCSSSDWVACRPVLLFIGQYSLDWTTNRHLRWLDDVDRKYSPNLFCARYQVCKVCGVIQSKEDSQWHCFVVHPSYAISLKLGSSAGKLRDIWKRTRASVDMLPMSSGLTVPSVSSIALICLQLLLSSLCLLNFCSGRAPRPGHAPAPSSDALAMRRRG